MSQLFKPAPPESVDDVRLLHPGTPSLAPALMVTKDGHIAYHEWCPLLHDYGLPAENTREDNAITLTASGEALSQRTDRIFLHDASFEEDLGTDDTEGADIESLKFLGQAQLADAKTAITNRFGGHPVLPWLQPNWHTVELTGPRSGATVQCGSFHSLMATYARAHDVLYGVVSRGVDSGTDYEGAIGAPEWCAFPGTRQGCPVKATVKVSVSGYRRTHDGTFNLLPVAPKLFCINMRTEWSNELPTGAALEYHTIGLKSAHLVPATSTSVFPTVAFEQEIEFTVPPDRLIAFVLGVQGDDATPLGWLLAHHDYAINTTNTEDGRRVECVLTEARTQLTITGSVTINAADIGIR